MRIVSSLRATVRREQSSLSLGDIRDSPAKVPRPALFAVLAWELVEGLERSHSKSPATQGKLFRPRGTLPAAADDLQTPTKER